MFYREQAAGPELDSLVKCIWVLERDYRGPFGDHEHLWADANGELLFTFGERYRLARRRGRLLPTAFVIGPFTRSFDLHSAGATSLVAARFLPWGFYDLSRLPMADLVDQIVPAERVFGAAVTALARELEACDHETRIERVREFLAEAARAASRRNDVHAVGARILAERGCMPIGALAREAGIDARKLERRFQAQVGMSPKTFARVVRFNYAKELIETDPDVELTAVSAAAGYADQAHFSKTFKEMFGITPGTFKRQMAEGRRLVAETNADVAYNPLVTQASTSPTSDHPIATSST